MKNRAFTIVELLVSIVLVLILILGVNQVFKIASDSVATGQALSTVHRDNRSAQAVIYADIKDMVTEDAPFFIINSTRVAAFRNKADMLSDLDFNESATLAPTDLAVRTVDVDANNSEADPLDQISRTVVNNRNHRVDEIKFFARDFYRRQTGNDGTFVSSVASSEALITYGHIRQPHDPANPTSLANARDPGIEHNDAKQTEAQNRNNYFAQQWILGRHVMVLREPELAGSDMVIEDSAGVRQTYIGRLSASPKRIEPIQENVSQATQNGSSPDGAFVLENGRYDLMGASIRSLDGIIRTGIASRLPNEKKWFDDVSYRYAGYTYPTKPHTSEGLARASTVFIPGCSQFIVEYAGDFLTQNSNTGASTTVAPDGVIDFVPIFNGVGNPVNRRVRWYGFPRNVDTSDDNDTTVPNRVRIRGVTGAAPGGTDMLDVVPLRDLILVTPGGTEQAPFEKIQVPNVLGNPTSGNNRLPVKDNYAATDTRNVANDAQYMCAWGPSGTYTNLSGDPVGDPPYPRMLRFVIAIDDPQGKLNDPQTFEYVVEVR